jgi:signal transduction histidine kinase/CheY-like chemotaxis protein
VTKDILYIEDDKKYRESIVELFKGQPYRFVEVESPEEGLKILQANSQIRVILLDLFFEYSTANDILDYVRSHSGDFKVIVLTSHEDLLSAEQAQKYGVFKYLPKAKHSTSEAIRFSVEKAFLDLERDRLDRKVRALIDVQKKLVESNDLRETLDLICQSVRNTVRAYTCHIRVYDLKRGDYRLKGYAGPHDSIRNIFEQPMTKGRVFSGVVAEKRISITPKDVQEDPDFRELKKTRLSQGSISPEEESYWNTVHAARIVPISTGLFGDLVDAVLNVNSEFVDYFDDEKCALIGEFGTLAAIAISKNWLETKRDEIHEDNSATSEMLSELSHELWGDDVMQGIYELAIQSVARIVNAEVVSLFLFNKRTELLENVAELRGSELLARPTEVYKPGQSLTGSVYTEKETIHLPLPGDQRPVKPMEDKRFDRANQDEYLDDVPSGRIEHYLGVPIIMGKEVRGVLRAINKKSGYYGELGSQSPLCLLERGFSRDCRNVMQITASHLAVAIRNAELLHEKGLQLKQIRSLGEVGKLINSTLDIGDVLQSTVRNMKDVMQAEICMLFLKDEGGERIILQECSGMEPIPGAFYPIGAGVTGSVARTGIPRLIKSAEQNNGKYDQEIRDYLAKKHGKPMQIESLMVVPIKAKETAIVGAMKVINKIDRRRFDNEEGNHARYNEADLEMFEMFADYVSVAISNAQIYTIANKRLAIAESNSTLSKLVTAVAHEINNTSGLIPSNVEGIRAELGTPSPAINEMLTLVRDAAEQAVEFANELAGFSNRWKGEKQVLDLNEIMQSAIKILRGELPRYKNSKNISLNLLLCSHALLCEVYKTPFIQIVKNIVINAYQALQSRRNGLVEISSYIDREGAAGTAVIRIKDNGPGIEPQNKQKIFEADFTTKPKGTGIGLWLVRTQLELIGGKIDVESELGDGASFILRIPIASNAGGS